MDVNSLISHLSSNGVKDFEGYGVKVSFHSRGPHSISIPFVGPELTKAFQDAPSEKIQNINDQPAMAQSLEGELFYDKVLNWSASPDSSETPTPLTGDEAPLTNVQS